MDQLKSCVVSSAKESEETRQLIQEFKEDLAKLKTFAHQDQDLQHQLQVNLLPLPFPIYQTLFSCTLFIYVPPNLLHLPLLIQDAIQQKDEVAWQLETTKRTLKNMGKGEATVRFQDDTQEKEKEVTLMKNQIKEGMKVMASKEIEVAVLSKQLAEAGKELAAYKEGMEVNANAADIIEMNIQLTNLKEQYEEVSTISRNQDKELLKKEAEVNSLTSNIQNGIKMMKEKDDELRKASAGLAETISELKKSKQALAQSDGMYEREFETQSGEMSQMKEGLTTMKEQLAEVIFPLALGGQFNSALFNSLIVGSFKTCKH